MADIDIELASQCRVRQRAALPNRKMLTKRLPSNVSADPAEEFQMQANKREFKLVAIKPFVFVDMVIMPLGHNFTLQLAWGNNKG